MTRMGLIMDAADLYSLTMEDLLPIAGFGERRAENLLHAIEASKNRPLHIVIAALGIRGVGRTVAKVLAAEFASIDELSAASPDVLDVLPGIGLQISAAILEWFRQPVNREFILKLRRFGVKLDRAASVVKTPQVLAGLTFVMTGTLPTMGRTEATRYIEGLGGRVTGNVSRRTDYVVVGKAPGSKYHKAEQLEISMLNEAELLTLGGN